MPDDVTAIGLLRERRGEMERTKRPTETPMRLHGIHHLTAISARISDNHRFYTHGLGMRLVKRSVNQDDVSAYHLFYADAVGSPGSDLTFFDWPVPPEVRGTRAITRTHLRVAGREALEYWRDRLPGHGATTGELLERDGRAVLDFEDAEGQRLTLVDDGGVGAAHPWERSPVPAAYQVRGLGPVVISVPDLVTTDAVLQRVMGLEPVREYVHEEHAGDLVRVYQMGEGGPGAELHVAEHRRSPPARQGAGGVHHVAFRSADADYDTWAEHLNTLGVPNSGKVDRFWFRSLYFREPNGILFEIATDGPGFAVDEDQASLGERVVLPPFLEQHRDEIVAGLKPID